MRRERDDDLALFVVAFGMSLTDYWSLTLGQREAIIRAHNQRNQK
ncbi:hypothetical protein [Agromyces sp. S2-1-8]|nr:hypothetical protein [Agromyces sp. S2-1-8]